MSEGAASRWGVIDAQSIAEARALIGVPLRRDRMQWVETATSDAIRQFCLGADDANPLWTDPRYAAGTRWGSQLAPPTFLYAVDATIVAPKLAGVQWIYAGTKWRWFDVIKVNDRITASAQLTAVEEKAGRRFGNWVLQSGEIVYRRNDAPVCVAQGRVARTPRRPPRVRGDGGEKSTAVPDREARSNVEAPLAVTGRANVELLGRRRCGPVGRYWDEVSVGDLLAPACRKLALADIFRWYMGSQGALHYGGAHGDAVRYRHRHDDFAINTRTGAKDSAARGHFSAREGKRVGMGGAYDVGLQRIAWVAAYLTDWMGDDGFLAELDISVLQPNLVGDTTVLAGEITKRWYDEHRFVAIDLAGTNQNGVLTTRGSAVVALPMRSGEPVALPLFGGDTACRAQVP